MGIKKEDRRRHISFKNNVREDELLKFLDSKTDIYGVSTYIKILLEKEMERERNAKTNRTE